MARTLSFGQKIAGGFGATIVLALLICGVATYALGEVVATKDEVISRNASNLIQAEKLQSAADRSMLASLSYLVTGEDRFVDAGRQARSEMGSVIAELRRRLEGDRGQRLIDEIDRIEDQCRTSSDRAQELRRTDGSLEAALKVYDLQAAPKFKDLEEAIDRLVENESKQLEDSKSASTQRADRAVLVMLIIAGAALFLTIVVGSVLTRSLNRQIGTAIQQIRSSSAELQAAANQQATGSREQSSATNEVTTTIRELLSSSRQIADSAQQVARIAEDTAKAAQRGDLSVSKAQDSILAIKRQVDLVVVHMLELGKKSQQIGTFLELINELSEQTNILAINATIESAGAGEAGRRFAVVAEEIRKLADRVGGSTKEIRTLVEEIRAAVNTTVMATEDGSKAVDFGAQQFMDVAAGFKQISGLVRTTTEVAKEIELSTKQQSTAVEQVTLAISNVAQAASENETTTRQTLDTSTQLAALSRNLADVILSRPSN